MNTKFFRLPAMALICAVGPGVLAGTALAAGYNFVAFDEPNTSYTTALYGINDEGTLVGTSGYQGFIYKSGVFTNIVFPGAQQTDAFGINNLDSVVGITSNGSGFIYNGGSFSAINISEPNLIYSAAAAINDAGVVVGWYDCRKDQITINFMAL
jgi:hypothetical protein